MPSRTPLVLAVAALALPGVAGAAPAAKIGHWKTRYQDVHQVSGCYLAGAPFGQIFAGGGVIVAGKAYPVTDGAVHGRRIDYAGPGVAVAFTPDEGQPLLEHPDGTPEIGRGPSGAIRITAGGKVVTVRGREECAVFE